MMSMKNHMIKPPTVGHPAATNNNKSQGNSNNTVTVKRVIPDRSHSVADIIIALESVSGRSDVDIATVKGWKVAVKRGAFRVGDKCVYIPIDTLIDTSKPHFSHNKVVQM